MQVNEERCMAYPARPRQSARIVTTNVEESAEAEVADRVTVKVKGRIVHCLTRQSVYLETVVVRCPKRNSLFKTIGRIPTIEKK